MPTIRHHLRWNSQMTNFYVLQSNYCLILMIRWNCQKNLSLTLTFIYYKQNAVWSQHSDKITTKNSILSQFSHISCKILADISEKFDFNSIFDIFQTKYCDINNLMKLQKKPQFSNITSNILSDNSILIKLPHKTGFQHNFRICIHSNMLTYLRKNWFNLNLHSFQTKHCLILMIR